jgi:hypothetical protein
MNEPTLESIKIELEEEKKKNQKLTQKLEKITEAHTHLQKFFFFFSFQESLKKKKISLRINLQKN